MLCKPAFVCWKKEINYLSKLSIYLSICFFFVPSIVEVRIYLFFRFSQNKNYLLFSFFLLRSSCLLSWTVGPLCSCHTTGAWAAPGLVGKTGSGAAPGGVYTTEACWAVHVRVYTWEAFTAPGGVLTPQHSSWRIRNRIRIRSQSRSPSRNVLKGTVAWDGFLA